MKKFKLYKDYSFAEIEKESNDLFGNNDNQNLEEIGDGMCGSDFVTVKDFDNSNVCSFVMTGYNTTSGSIYTCVYNDWK